MGRLVKKIQKALRNMGNPEIAVHSQRFFKAGKGEYGEGDRFLGIRVPVLRKQVKRYEGISIDDAAELLQSEYHEVRLFSLLSLVDIFRKGRHTEKSDVYALYLKHTHCINNWDLVDCSAEHIVGAFLVDKSRKPLYALARSEILWERRISILSTFHFIKANEFSDTLEIARILRDDREDLIHKAVGWMLREVGKRDMAAEEQFLKDVYQNMPRTMLRYAIEKFPEETRIQYLRGEV